MISWDRLAFVRTLSYEYVKQPQNTMAGHSQFKNIMYRKGAQDAKRNKVFTKLIREITVAAKENPDPDSNPRLRSAIYMARKENMPKDNVDRAIKKATGGGDDANYEEMRYEGYGPAGVAIIVDALTDNRNRTASEVRSAFSKHGGNLGETNSVSFMFNHVGFFQYPKSIGSEERMFEVALDVGAEDVQIHNDSYDVLCTHEYFHVVRDAIVKILGEPAGSGLRWEPKNLIHINDFETAQKLIKLIDALEDNDDIQTVSSSMDLSFEIMEKLGQLS